MAFVVRPSIALTQVTIESGVNEAAEECARARQSSCWNESNVVLLVVQGLHVVDAHAAMLLLLTCQDGVFINLERRWCASSRTHQSPHETCAHEVHPLPHSHLSQDLLLCLC